MDTNEHIELGNSLKWDDWNVIKENPFIFVKQDILFFNLQGIAANRIPYSTRLTLSAGEIIGLSGDYFGGKEIALELPTHAAFCKQNDRNIFSRRYSTLGQYLINEAINYADKEKLINSYLQLANPKNKQNDIDRIHAINNGRYVPFFNNLNSYIQQMMFAIRVKGYSLLLKKNLSHFSPWSVRIYIIGHHLALKYAQYAFMLKQKAENPGYLSENQDFNIWYEEHLEELNKRQLYNLAHRYQALALAMEFFTFHYYTDHFAAGHGSFVGDLRALLPQKFGLLGSILVNDLHNELNRIYVYTKQVYAPSPAKDAPPVQTGGDSNFNSPPNYFNRRACLAGMQASLSDLHTVLTGGPAPIQKNYGGLNSLPDIDEQYRQPQPLILLGEENKIYYRKSLRHIHLVGPKTLQKTKNTPQEYGYVELKSKWQAFVLVFKLRILSSHYQGKLKELSQDALRIIEAEEQQLHPQRQSIPNPPVRAIMGGRHAEASVSGKASSFSFFSAANDPDSPATIAERKLKIFS